MKAHFNEYEGSFSLELVPESLEEQLRCVRMGMQSKVGGRTWVSVLADTARISVHFDKKRNRSSSFKRL